MRFNFLSAILLLFIGSSIAFAQSAEFTYQGKLTDNGTAANGTYDFEFRLFDVVSGSTALAVQQKSPVLVTAGVFTVQLDFGADKFNGSARFLEIGVRPAGNPNPYNVLTPRQPVTATPYAVRSLNSSTADALSPACVGCVTSTQVGSVSGSVVTGTIPVASIPAGSSKYLQNTTSQQPASNFNISGNGTAGGTLSANAVDATAQYNIGGQKVLSAPGVNLSNLFAGFGAGQANTTGLDNSFFGRDTGMSNTSGEFNSFYGIRAGQSNTEGQQNSFFGGHAGVSNQTGFANSFFGAFSGQNNIAGQQNTFVGYNSANSNAGGSFNTFIGSYSNGAAAITNATAIGYKAMATQSNTVVLGSIAGVNDALDNTKVGIGTTAPTERLHVAGNELVTGNLIIQGNLSLAGTLEAALPSGSGSYIQNNTAPQAFANFNISGSGTAGGTLSANAVNVATQYNIVGNRVLSVAGTNNLFVGVGAGQSNTGIDNSFFGYQAGQANSGAGNSFFGLQAGFRNTIGQLNAFFGYQAGQANTGGNTNSFFGVSAGFYNTTGNKNTFIGNDTGFSNSVENNNTFIGNSADGAAGITNSTAIGFRAKVTQSNSLVLGSINGINGATADTKVGIGTTAPAGILQVRATPLNPGSATFFKITGTMINSKDHNGGNALAGPETVMVLAREGVAGQAFANFARFDLKRYEAASTASRSQLDLRLSHGDLFIEADNTPVIMSLQSGGNVAIPTQGSGLILRATNGPNCYRLTVDNAGALTTALIACP